ncbi:UbiX family flavin prenyltransferase [Dongia sp.]|uniref:UbiX family flavin prenyltransferase n=1 Tax=Dongia sp. TaxID=1977262 RepID=UPI0035B1FB73
MAKQKNSPKTSSRAGTTHPPARLIIGITGASGIIYGIRLLELLKGTMIETHLVMSRSAEVTLAYETSHKVAAVKALADYCHANEDLAAPISSGSFLTLGMIVAPCSAKSLAEIASGVTPTLIARAADVVLKERRRLVLMLRETPLHLGHIRNMASVTEMGGIIAPPVPAMYAQPQSIGEMVDQSLGRVLDLFGLHLDQVTRWDKNAKKRGR